jgi:hypothetical protein
MSPDQVLAASKGQFKRCDKSCTGQDTEFDTAKVFGSYATGEFKFNAFANFDKANRLSRVNLDLVNPSQAPSLVGSLRGRYGEPASDTRTSIMRLVVWHTKTDQISVMTIDGASAGLSYQPRLTDSNRGL